MCSGLWRVGPRAAIVAIAGMFALTGAACSEGPGPAEGASATVVGDTSIPGGGSSITEAPAATGVDARPVLAVDEDGGVATTAPGDPTSSTAGSEDSDGSGEPTTSSTDPSSSSTSGSASSSGSSASTGSSSAGGSTTTAAPGRGSSTTTGVESRTGSTRSTPATTSTTRATTTRPPATTAVTRPAAGGGTVIGSGSAASCTGQAVVDAVAAGGSISFDCGPNPVTIAMPSTAKVVNANGPVTIDGGGRVTLSGQGRHRILYQNTCDQAQGWTTSHCQNQDHPHLTVRNIGFTAGNSTGDRTEGGGGGAILVRGGRLTIENATFTDNRCDGTGPDLGGAAVRALSQYQGGPVRVSGSTFRGGVCSNGSALSSIGVSWVIDGSTFTGNRAVGNGANPARGGTPGGGSGGALYFDGNDFTVEVRNSRIEDNQANEGGGAIFFVSNNRTGRLTIDGSTLRRNPSAGFETQGYPGIFFLGAGSPTVRNSTLE